MPVEPCLILKLPVCEALPSSVVLKDLEIVFEKNESKKDSFENYLHFFGGAGE